MELFERLPYNLQKQIYDLYVSDWSNIYHNPLVKTHFTIYKFVLDELLKKNGVYSGFTCPHLVKPEKYHNPKNSLTLKTNQYRNLVKQRKYTLFKNGQSTLKNTKVTVNASGTYMKNFIKQELCDFVCDYN